MRNNLIVALVIIIIVAVGSAGIYWAWQKQKVQTQPTPSPTPSPISNFPSTDSKANGAVPSLQPQAGTDTASVNLGIEIITPNDKAKVSSPVKVKGLANVPEELVAVEIKDANGNVLESSQASACFDSQPCLFEASVVFSTYTQDSGTIEVHSPESGYSDSVQIFF
ncbi:hypothetical protein A3D07_03205 [Candidatus Curtissbacteria bacterium RIFCSPHIGHO2_02_FULL_42_15]|uniref:Bacterial spore germination immunoglobulin-like domain-containing protein n=1 Tax=Candidatus Curtissbacteria bacterium RIFCSPHIGHO2_02_FULL_42_15 TaxID=1797716 RepID=A0A1F5GD25_9BACT|nr:MAG: hypothetical protein A3D07_03205 [Candidatus Curtissbacteria bacterium RIFCSPHIGHO2_02_FULL_42_15]